MTLDDLIAVKETLELSQTFVKAERQHRYEEAGHCQEVEDADAALVKIEEALVLVEQGIADCLDISAFDTGDSDLNSLLEATEDTVLGRCNMDTGLYWEEKLKSVQRKMGIKDDR